MGKLKRPGVQNLQAFQRTSYLYQASAFLALQSSGQGSSTEHGTKPHSAPADDAEGGTAKSQPHSITLQNQSRALLTEMRTISLKMQLRLSSSLKITVCKFCDTLLVEGQSCTSTVENKSKGGRKPWADNLVRKCVTCGREKRFLIQAPRQKGKQTRSHTQLEVPTETPEQPAS